MIIQAMPYPAGEASTPEIFMFAGTSDMMSNGELGTPTDNATRSNFWEIPMSGSSAGTAELADEPFAWSNAIDTGRVSILGGFGRQRADDAPDRDVIVVPIGETITALDSGGEWDPPSGAGYLAATSGINSAETQFTSSSLKAIGWAGTGRHVQEAFSIEISKATLEDFFATIKSDQSASTAAVLTFDTPPLFAYGMDYAATSSQASGYQEWLEYLRDQTMAEARRAHVRHPWRYVENDMDGGTLARDSATDNHMGKAAYSAIGVAAAKIYPTLNALATGAPDAITTTADVNGWLKLTIPASGLTKVVLRYRENGTADAWTEIDRWPHWLGQAPGESMYCNIPDTNNVALEVQVKAVSYGGESAWSSSQVIAAVQRSKGWRINATALNGRQAHAIFQVVFRPEAGGPDMQMLGGEGSFYGNRFDTSRDGHEPWDGRPGGTSLLSADNAYLSGLAYGGFYYSEPTYVGHAEYLCGPDTASTERALSAGSVGRCAPTDSRAQCQGGGGATWTSVISISGETGWSANEVRAFS